MNITHTGELGCVFYIPNEFALHVFETLFDAGQEFGIRHIGYYAMRALRIEKFYAFWGQDLDSQSTPKDCGRNFRVKINSDIDFIGKTRLAEIEKEGRKKALVMLLLDKSDHDYEVDPWPWGKEPIFRNGHYVGSVTTASYGFSLKRHVAIGFVANVNTEGEAQVVTDDWVRGGEYEIEIAGTKYSARVRLSPPVLPARIHIEGSEQTWLIKSEPESRFENGIDLKFGLEDLKKEPQQTACWDGVRNYQARNFMRQMKVGQKAFFYHSNCKVPGIAGLVEVVRESYDDHTQFDKKDPHYDPKSAKDNPKWSMVDVKFVRDLKRYISLPELKKLHLDHKSSGGPLAQVALFTSARLSVQPIRSEEFEFILSLENDCST
eukprot:maker-scaffold23_size669530-snap-gene-1.33 protein:Tk11062 transcript:maker-scaffold23_size669530-snap-gene-1.33-mRNA-1 annotation:"predicted protein"